MIIHCTGTVPKMVVWWWVPYSLQICDSEEGTIDNSWVVSYSPLLCKMFQTHITVEHCSLVKAIKYVCLEKQCHKQGQNANSLVGRTDINSLVGLSLIQTRALTRHYSIYSNKVMYQSILMNCKPTSQRDISAAMSSVVNAGIPSS